MTCAKDAQKRESLIFTHERCRRAVRELQHRMLAVKAELRTCVVQVRGAKAPRRAASNSEEGGLKAVPTARCGREVSQDHQPRKLELNEICLLGRRCRSGGPLGGRLGLFFLPLLQRVHVRLLHDRVRCVKARHLLRRQLHATRGSRASALNAERRGQQRRRCARGASVARTAVLNLRLPSVARTRQRKSGSSPPSGGAPSFGADAFPALRFAAHAGAARGRQRLAEHALVSRAQRLGDVLRRLLAALRGAGMGAHSASS